ncbi:MAG: antitoxin [Anaerolineae bacterium]|jgi:metal-responsive CopG/Arc/MetJ family transcriptional regulator|nr:antitoxin [Anaerolineae bacterium]MDX9829852.1 antitoxin [Anaerolineae bacterium]
MIYMEAVRKITISLPGDLVDFADEEAARLETNRSAYIARALAEIKAAKEEQLAAEGYRYYAEEALQFAEESSGAVAEALKHAG